ncbi:hypothetical protein VP01_1765g1 [Puccinia sorghi]|uniref:Uncharacterized protein n=1 Tax=Puccinia sorghi TaxID=27349 RepID=A0A0L6VGP7_9BASI|nr:hypothetical protein VP01_1765g1 [Puccinia sorghi]
MSTAGTQEVLCAASWEIEFKSIIKAKAAELDDLEKTVEQGDGPTNIKSWTSITLGNWMINLKLMLIKWELVLKLCKHWEVVVAWAEDAKFLNMGSWDDLVWRQGIRPELFQDEVSQANDRSESSETSSDSNVEEMDAPQDGGEWVGHTMLNTLFWHGNKNLYIYVIFINSYFHANTITTNRGSNGLNSCSHYGCLFSLLCLLFWHLAWFYLYVSGFLLCYRSLFILIANVSIHTVNQRNDQSEPGRRLEPVLHRLKPPIQRHSDVRSMHCNVASSVPHLKWDTVNVMSPRVPPTQPCVDVLSTGLQPG